MQHRGQNILLLVASYIFYMTWDWRFISLILLSTIVDYYCGIQVRDSKDKKKFFVAVSMVVNLAVLGFFKYYNFFTENLVELTSVFGWQPDDLTLNIILPVGISFYTFQTMSYTIDIYRKEIEPERNILNFALFVSFFPQLVAGPIERAKNLLPQIQTKRIISKEMVRNGIWMIAWGFYLKIFIADNLAFVVDRVFATDEVIAGGEALFGIYAFAFQIFGDFAGYSSIAIGVGALMGFTLRTNFLFPYFVTNPQNFWHNWHISLSSWLRDYLYIPLGGNRGGEMMLYRNLFLTMLLGGIWHGAAWTFVIWGIYQGSILMVHRYYSPKFKKLGAFLKVNTLPDSWVHAFKVLFMFQVTCFGWLIFRANSIDQILNFTYSIFFNFMTITPATKYYFLLLCFYAIPLLLIQHFQIRFKSENTLDRFPAYARTLIYVGIYFCIIALGEYGTRQFIYFQF
ncbi:MBOAT family protein [Balneola sp. MJW-20]|uniref:MBOAT family O-acyltransferase n=1 Tax=Gracilimonas aurantiaca TaxID=3234185 RepID=UPI003467A64E